MYYSPNDHQGVNELMGNFSERFPGVHLKGRKSSNKVKVEYEANLFETWASLEFDLSEEQIASGNLITSATELSTVNYDIRISPIQMELPDSKTDSDVYEDSISLADSWANSGYLTIQNFVASHLAQSYDDVDPNFEVQYSFFLSVTHENRMSIYDICLFSTFLYFLFLLTTSKLCYLWCLLLCQMGIFIQRYPKDTSYEKAPDTDLSFIRFMLWKWVASVLLTCAVILPILGLSAQTVFERENQMKDLLQISGLLDSAYWISYEIAAMILAETISIIVCLLLLAGTVLTQYHLGPYLLLMTMFSLALFPMLMAFGFVVFRSEYYGLPTFLLTIALCVAGDYMANDYNLTIGTKCK